MKKNVTLFNEYGYASVLLLIGQLSWHDHEEETVLIELKNVLLIIIRDGMELKFIVKKYKLQPFIDEICMFVHMAYWFFP